MAGRLGNISFSTPMTQVTESAAKGFGKAQQAYLNAARAYGQDPSAENFAAMNASQQELNMAQKHFESVNEVWKGFLRMIDRLISSINPR